MSNELLLRDVVSDVTYKILVAGPIGNVDVVEETFQRVKMACARWDVRDVEPLDGGWLSIVAKGWVAGRRVVVKAPLSRDLGEGERVALNVLRGVPRVLDAWDGVLLMEYIDGVLVETTDSVSTAEALRLLHGGGNIVVCPVGLPWWEDRRQEMFGEYARRVREFAPESAWVVDMAEESLPRVLEMVRTVCHGDFQGKNILRLRDGSGVRVLDPYGVWSPVAWDAAFAVRMIAGTKGDPSLVLEAAEDCGITGVAEWFPVAAVAVIWTSGRVYDYACHADVFAWIRD